MVTECMTNLDIDWKLKMTKSEIEKKILHDNYFNGHLCNNPKPLHNQTEPKLIMYDEFGDIDSLEYSVIVPMFNADTIVQNTVMGIINNMDSYFELIVILDACEDDTEKKLIELFERLDKNELKQLKRIIIIKQETPIFETSCDNIGFSISSGKFLIEIQVDMEMTEYGFNSNMVRAFEYSDIIGVSGRCTHVHKDAIGVGKLGVKLWEPLSNDICRDTLYMCGTCNRGPLMLDKEKLKELNYLDEHNFFMEDSDHDLFARAYNLKGWKNGYIAIEFNNPITSTSGFRATRLSEETISTNAIVAAARGDRSDGGFYNKPDIIFPTIECRKLKNRR